MASKRIILVEDEADMADLVATRLQREGYKVEVAGDGMEGLNLIRSSPPDLALLDLMLPGMSGTELINQMRNDPRTTGVPIIVLTAKSEESDIIVGLQLGADDYVTKPFSMSVLLARVAAVLRRVQTAGPAGKGHTVVGLIQIDQERHAVEVDGEPVTLTLTEFRILLALAAARGRVLTRNQLIDQGMGLDTMVTDRTIDVHLTALRRKLGPAREYIKTVRGVGYKLTCENDETT